MNMKTLVIAMLGLPLAACGGGADDTRDDAADTDDPRGGVIGEGYVDALDKAEAVDDLAKERKEALDEAVDPPE